MDLDLLIKPEAEGKERKYCDHCNIFFPDEYFICQKCSAALGLRTAGLTTGDIMVIRLPGPGVWTPAESPFVVMLPDAEAGIVRDRIGAPSKASLREYLTVSYKYLSRRFFIDIPPEQIKDLYPEIKAADVKDKI